MGRSAAQNAQQPADPLAVVQPGQPELDARDVTCLVVDSVRLCGLLLSSLPPGHRAGHDAALQALPLMAAIVQELVPPAAQAVLEPGTAAGWWLNSTLRDSAATWPLDVAVALQLEVVLDLHIGSSDELLQCCAATDAALSMLAVTAQLVPDIHQQLEKQSSAHAAAELAASQSDLLRAAQHASHDSLRFWEAANHSIWAYVRGGAPSAQGISSPQPVQQLHLKACRLMHRLCSLPSEPLAQALGLPEDSTWSWLLNSLSFTFLSVNDLLLPEERRMASGSTERLTAQRA